MDVDANRMGQTHSDTKKQQLMNENKCFYCEIKGHQVLQSTQFFVLLPTPSNLWTRRTSRTNHTDPSEYIPTNNTTIDTSQSMHTHATDYL